MLNGFLYFIHKTSHNAITADAIPKYIIGTTYRAFLLSIEMQLKRKYRAPPITTKNKLKDIANKDFLLIITTPKLINIFALLGCASPLANDISHKLVIVNHKIKLTITKIYVIEDGNNSSFIESLSLLDL